MTAFPGITSADLDTLQDYIDNDDRGGFYLKIYQLTGDPEALLQAQISTFSNSIGGIAYAANSQIKGETGSSYPSGGANDFSLQIASAENDLIVSLVNNPANGGVVTATTLGTHIGTTAADKWSALGLSSYFPGAIITDYAKWQAGTITTSEYLDDLAAGGAGLDAGAQNLLSGLVLGKGASDYSGVTGYTSFNYLDGDGNPIATSYVNSSGVTVYVAPASNPTTTLATLFGSGYDVSSELLQALAALPGMSAVRMDLSGSETATVSIFGTTFTAAQIESAYRLLQSDIVDWATYGIAPTVSEIAIAVNAGYQSLMNTAVAAGTMVASEVAAIEDFIGKAYAGYNNLVAQGSVSTLLQNYAGEIATTFAGTLGGLSGFFDELTGPNNSWWSNTFQGPKTGSPIILDLDGNGVTTIPESAGTYFNLRNTDGFAEQTGWVGPSDGLLVWDRNSTGTIDNGGELFGNYTLESDGTTVASNGFAALASYDSNSDGKIDSGDSIWSDLQVWIDSNSNGVTDSGELHSLSSLGIQSLNLSDTDEGDTVTDAAGNNPRYVSTYTKTDSSTAAMTDVIFADNTTQTVPLSAVATDSTIDALPDLLGAGSLYSLHQAMALDTTGDLETAVSAFTTDTSISSRDSDLENILIDWAGAAGVDPTSRNSNLGDFNAQHLAVLEAAMGTSFVQWDWGSNPGDPGPLTAPQLEGDYFYFSERMYAELAAQTFLAPYYNEITTATSGGATTFDFSTALSDLFATASDDDIKEFYRTVFASGVLDSEVNYAGLLSALATNKPGLVSDVGTIVAPYYAYDATPYVSDPHASLYDLYSSAQNETIVGGLGGSTIYANLDPYISGSIEVSNTTVYGNAGTNNIYANGNLGVDKLYGGTGDDTIADNGTLSAGTIIDGGAGDNTLVLDTSPDISQATITNIQTLEMNGTPAIMTLDQFNDFTYLTNSGGSSQVDAATAGTYDLTSKTVTGSFDLSALDTSGDVTLIGNDQADQTLWGGAGTDVLESGNGAGDILYAGSGSTTVTSGSGAGDKLYGGSGSSSTYTLEAGDGAGDLLYGSGGGTSTMIAGNGGDSLYDSNSIDDMEGGTGNDTFYLTYANSGTSITGGGGTDQIESSVFSLTGVTISGVATLGIQGNNEQLTAAEFTDLTSIAAVYGGNVDLYAMTAGTYDLNDDTLSGGTFDLVGYDTAADITLIGNDQNGQRLYAGTGTDTLEAGNGTGDLLYAGGAGTTTMVAGTGGDILNDSNSVDTMEGGSGNDTFNITYGTSGTSVSGGGGTDQIVSSVFSLTGITISGVSDLEIQGVNEQLTASEFADLTSITAVYGGPVSLYAMTAGTYNLSDDTLSGGAFNLVGYDTGADITLIGDNENGQTIYGGAGTDTLQAGNGTGDNLYAEAGDTTLIAGTGTETLHGGSGTDTYQFGSAFAQDTINNNTSATKSAASGEVDFLSGTTDENLWFQQSGNDLQVDLVGTSDQITLSNWYSDTGSQVSSFTADGKALDSQLSTLVSAMATYAAANPGFDPTTATSMPTDTTLQSAITSAWHT